MPEQRDAPNLPPPLVALAGWLLPGAGYWLIGERTRGLIVFAAIVLLYLLGLLIAGVRVVEVPGFDNQSGYPVRVLGRERIMPGDPRYGYATWAMTSRAALSEIANKPWFVGQVLAGPLCIGSAGISIQLAQQGYDLEERIQVSSPRPHAPLETVGTLYTAVAGMLNLLVIIDATYRAGLRRAAALAEAAA